MTVTANESGYDGEEATGPKPQEPILFLFKSNLFFNLGGHF